jgi:hypothetical protein
MKTKSFFILCFLLSIGMTQLSAQNSNTGNGAITYWESLNMEGDILALDGTVLDKLDCILRSHVQVHIKDGVWIRADYEAHGIAIARRTGEEFKYTEIGKQPIYSWDADGNPTGFDFFRVYLKGNHGTHLMIEATLDFTNWMTTITQISWPGGKYWDGN